MRNQFVLSGLLPLLLFFGSSCRESSGPEGGAEESGQSKTESSRLSSRDQESSGRRFRVRSSKDEVNAWLAQFQESEEPSVKRELFEKIFLEVPPEEHDLVLDLVVEDLRSPQSINFVSDYLEFSSFLSPALQLPGMVRILEESGLEPLQREAMELQLKEELGVGPDEQVSDWRPLVEERLRKIPGVITE